MHLRLAVDSGSAQPRCETCPLEGLAFCHPLNGKDRPVAPLGEGYRRFSGAQALYRQGQTCDDFMVLYDGWAIRYRDLSYGKRQIFSVILPGDPVSMALIRRDSLDCSVTALTEGLLCTVSRQSLVERVRSDPHFADRLQAFCAREARIADERIADLSRSASERVARFLLDLYTRLRLRGLVEDGGFAFPLRHHHLGDALGLTQIHIGRVMRALRGDRLIEISRDRLVIRDYDGLLKIASTSDQVLASLAKP